MFETATLKQGLEKHLVERALIHNTNTNTNNTSRLIIELFIALKFTLTEANYSPVEYLSSTNFHVFNVSQGSVG